MRTVDTDVVVLAVASFSKIAPDELWVAFGVGSSFWHNYTHSRNGYHNESNAVSHSHVFM
jgi:hypothetical protein